MNRRELRRRTFLASLAYVFGAGTFFARVGSARATNPADVLLYKGWVIKPSDLDL